MGKLVSTQWKSVHLHGHNNSTVRKVHVKVCRNSNLSPRKLLKNIVRGAEVILPIFSRDKSILLLNCPLDA